MFLISVIACTGEKGDTGSQGIAGPAGLLTPSPIIKTNSTWSGSIDVFEKVYILPGVTLTLQSNTTITVYGDGDLRVYGVLNARAGIQNDINITGFTIKPIHVYGAASVNFYGVKLEKITLNVMGAETKVDLVNCMFTNAANLMSTNEKFNGIINVTNCMFIKYTNNIRKGAVEIGSSVGTCTINLHACDFLYNYGSAVSNTSPAVTITLNGCYIRANNKATGVTISTAAPNDSNSPRQYDGVSLVTAPAVTTNNLF